ncbi:uncharacterized protein LOC135480434 isoform X2 [Liolophura sinensis]|uniref:uncharacterized protein LOC135480434 isoform X2 n=1 Tax=Liolophura sinensis TaxID=3198878 RepID=UPI003158486E
MTVRGSGQPVNTAVKPAGIWYKTNMLPSQRVVSNMPGTKFVDELIQSHNEYRRRHQVSPLRHSPELSDIAQAWAEQLARDNGFQHSKSRHEGQPLGENISLKWSSRSDSYSGKDVSDQWYSEIQMYQFGCEPRSTNCGHFTQMVWRDSKEIGVGKAQTPDGKTIVVANYKPAGNFLGKFSQNVLPVQQDAIPTRPFGLSNNSYGHSSSLFNSKSAFSNVPEMSSHTSYSGQSRPVRTYTTTEGSGSHAVTKTVVEETVTFPDGRKVTTKKETVTNGGTSQGPMAGGGEVKSRGFGHFDKEFNDRFQRLGLADRCGLEANKFSREARSDSPRNSGQRTGLSGSSSGSSESGHCSPQTMAEFSKDCLASHNDKRAKHRVAPLVHSQELTRHAQKWAEHMASTSQFGHSDCRLSNGDRLGENIACKWSSQADDYTGGQATDQWYSEIKNMDFQKVGLSSGTGHFTQVVWKGSREFGVGKARGRDGKVYVVANYRPAGNMIGEYEKNVFPPK